MNHKFREISSVSRQSVNLMQSIQTQKRMGSISWRLFLPTSQRNRKQLIIFWDKLRNNKSKRYNIRWLTSFLQAFNRLLTLLWDLLEIIVHMKARNCQNFGKFWKMKKRRDFLLSFSSQPSRQIECFSVLAKLMTKRK